MPLLVLYHLCVITPALLLFAFTNKSLTQQILRIYSSNWVAKFFFTNAGFNKVVQLDDIQAYSPCYNPAVVPILRSGSTKNAVPIPEFRQIPAYPYRTVDYYQLYLSGKVTPTEVVEALLALISKDEQSPGKHSVAFLQVRQDLVREAAKASTQRYQQGTPLGVLDGVPIGVKDEYNLSGYRKSYASRIDFTPAHDGTAWCVTKLQEAGAVVIGKTIMHELGMDTTNLNPIHGTPSNPHNPNFYTGGSSGGTGYVVAAGLVPFALGADGGGSIRIPSSFCGIYGIKPSHDRVSARPCLDLAATTCVYGPMAGSLEDLMLAYRIMAVPDPSHPVSSCFPNPLDEIPLASQTSANPKYIGVDDAWVSHSSPSIRAIFSRLMSYYASLPHHTLVPVSIPHARLGQLAHAFTILNEGRSGVSRAQIAQLTAPNQILMRVGEQASAQDFIAAQRLRSLYMSHLAALWQKYPGMVIATPTTPMEGWPIERPDTDLKLGASDGDKSIQSMLYVWLANFTGCPAISWPIAETIKTGVPIGVMGMGEWGSEEQLFEWARTGEMFWESVAGEGVGEIEESGMRRLRGPSQKSGGLWSDVLGTLLQK